MKNHRYLIGPKLRQLRIEHHYSVEQIAEFTDLSVSTINKLEQGLRSLTISKLFVFMELFQCDANTILCVDNSKEGDSIDCRLGYLPVEKKNYLEKTFSFMIEQAKAVA